MTGGCLTSFLKVCILIARPRCMSCITSRQPSSPFSMSALSEMVCASLFKHVLRKPQIAPLSLVTLSSVMKPPLRALAVHIASVISFWSHSSTHFRIPSRAGHLETR